jgi:hypothetical protein
VHVLLDGPPALVAIMTAALTPWALRASLTGRLPLIAFVTGVIAASSMWLAPGTLSVALVAPYAITCAVAGAIGVRRVVRAPWPPAELAQHMALVVLAGAAVWLVAYRAGYPLLDYPPLWVLLTAAHFHVAGCYLPLVVGNVAKGAFANAVAFGCVLGLPLTAIGILVTGPLETIAAMIMAVSAFGAAVVLVTQTTGLLRISGIPLAVGMVLAMLYALRDFGTAIVIGTLDPLSSMIVSHAVLDTVFAALALIALNRKIAFTPHR